MDSPGGAPTSSELPDTPARPNKCGRPSSQEGQPLAHTLVRRLERRAGVLARPRLQAPRLGRVCVGLLVDVGCCPDSNHAPGLPPSSICGQGAWQTGRFQSVAPTAAAQPVAVPAALPSCVGSLGCARRSWRPGRCRGSGDDLALQLPGGRGEQGELVAAGGLGRRHARCAPLLLRHARSRGVSQPSGARPRGMSSQPGLASRTANLDGGRRSARPVALCCETASNPLTGSAPRWGCALLPATRPASPIAARAHAPCSWPMPKSTSPAHRGPRHGGVQWLVVTMS
jgi:hypothetical protein